MAWFNKKPMYSSVKGAVGESSVPDGLFKSCPECSHLIYGKDLDKNLGVCDKCGYHSRLPALVRIRQLTDEGSFQEQHAGLKPVDVLEFKAKKSYAEQIEATINKIGMNEAVVIGEARINGMRVSLAVMDFRFIGGSMSSVVGEKVTRAMEYALKEEIPVVTVTSTGGARMQESILSLMQMAKTSALCAQLDARGIPFISILTYPSTAGVMASFASLGDIIIAEPDCMIGFAGRRVIEQTVREHLPKGFQTAEFVQEHGFVDLVCHRDELRNTVARVLHFLWEGKAQIHDAVPAMAAVEE